MCTRWVRADLLYEAIEQHRVTHFGGAPIVMNLLLNAADEHKRGKEGQSRPLPTGRHTSQDDTCVVGGVVLLLHSLVVLQTCVATTVS